MGLAVVFGYILWFSGPGGCRGDFEVMLDILFCAQRNKQYNVLGSLLFSGCHWILVFGFSIACS